MAEIILSAPITVLLEKLVLPKLIKIFCRARVHNDINKWKKMLITIKAVLNDAEEKQVTNRSVKIWLDEIRDFASDLEDILDEFATKALRVNLKAKSQASTSKVPRLIPACCTSFKPNVYVFNSQIEPKIKDISTRLEDIVSQKRNLDLICVGGVGKTTLARLLYNDDRVDISFDLKGWVCVSEEFDVFHVTKAI